MNAASTYGHISLHKNVRTSKLQTTGNGFLGYFKNELLAAKTKQEFQDVVFRHLYWMPVGSHIEIKDLFSEKQPAYRAAIIQSIKNFIDQHTNTAEWFVEFNTDYTKFRKL